MESKAVKDGVEEESRSSPGGGGIAPEAVCQPSIKRRRKSSLLRMRITNVRWHDRNVVESVSVSDKESDL